MFELSVTSFFASAHHLLNYEGKCENQHGHNWKVQVWVKGKNLDNSNILVDFKLLKKYLNDVLDTLDHKDLNKLTQFENQSPSSEFIAKFIYTKMKQKLNIIHKVAIWETPNSCCVYYE